MAEQNAENSSAAQNRRVVGFAARVSKKPSDENAFLARAKKATNEVKQFSMGSDIIGGLIEFSESGAIDDVVIHSHGFSGGIMGDGEDVGLYTESYAGSVQKQNFPGIETSTTFVDAISSGKVDIARNGVITIFGCNCSNIAQEISAKLGSAGRGDISVTGANNSVYENAGSAAVDRRTTGISQGSRGSFITYQNGIQVSTRRTIRY